jgi:S-adenosylmethionine:tRNA ribosyltransferase-isomerase
MVSYRSTDRIVHTRFHNIGSFLTAGDVVVINTSGTLNAALNATRSDGSPIELHRPLICLRTSGSWN